MKRWLITGASSGFGRLLAERVSSDGDHVIAVARRSDRLRELAAAHDFVTPLAVDLTAPDVEQRLRTAIDAAGGSTFWSTMPDTVFSQLVEQTPDGEARAVFDRHLFCFLGGTQGSITEFATEPRGGRVPGTRNRRRAVGGRR